MTEMQALTAKHSARVRELMEANNREVERRRKLRKALGSIKSTQGKVCQSFEVCEHAACASSYAAWAISDKAIAADDLAADNIPPRTRTGKVDMTEAPKCDACSHPALCRAQGEEFCLKVYTNQRHREYLRRRVQAKAEETAPGD